MTATSARQSKFRCRDGFLGTPADRAAGRLADLATLQMKCA
jgi:hypothetical protein